jgi:uracil phosphoribosyltransferase
MFINLGEKNSVFNQFISEIRDHNIQKDPMRFRRNIERIGEIFAYEISKVLPCQKQTVVTPLGELEMALLAQQPVIASILRAGLPLHQGFLNYFDRAQNAFISAYRRYYRDGSFEIQLDYMSAPNLNDKILILADPMLASGKSLLLTYEEILKLYKPTHTHIVSIIASSEGLDVLQKKFNPKDTSIWVGAIDGELTAKYYIVPGLGDAGDLAYGEKK